MPSFDSWTSNSSPSAPQARPWSKASTAFSGRSAAPPLWASTMGTAAILAAFQSGKMASMASRPVTLAPRRQAVAAGTVKHRPVKEEIRDNLIARLRAGGTLFPGIIGYDDSVVPQIVNAVLSQHNFILLGLRGQAKSRILRAL